MKNDHEQQQKQPYEKSSLFSTSAYTQLILQLYKKGKKTCNPRSSQPNNTTASANYHEQQQKIQRK